MVNKSKNTELHIIVPNEDYQKWQKHLKDTYNGLPPAMAKFIRYCVDKEVARGNKRGEK